MSQNRLELTQAVYPRAHTCFNRIDLPIYSNMEALRSHLLAMIADPTGFTAD